MSTTRRAKKLSQATQINMSGSTVQSSGQMKLLEGNLYPASSFDVQVNFCQVAILSYRRPASHLIAVNWGNGKLLNNVARSLIQSHLDYANSLYTGMSSANFDRQQWYNRLKAR